MLVVTIAGLVIAGGFALLRLGLLALTMLLN